MKNLALALAAVLAAGACTSQEAPAPQTAKAPAAPATATPAATAPMSEKEKAMTEPYANDYGPDTLDVSSYPADARAGYKALQAKCTACHTASRPLNSQFVETAGKDKAARKARLLALKKSTPQLFTAKNIWKVEDSIWQRYVKRMMSKPGCEVTKAEGKKIWAFLAHDSRVRKIGKNSTKWQAHRERLIQKFKSEHPKRYSALYGAH